MKWLRGETEYYLITDDGRFTISKSFVRGRVCFVAARAGKGGADDVVRIERGLDPGDDAARLAALDRCKAACEAARV